MVKVGILIESREKGVEEESVLEFTRSRIGFVFNNTERLLDRIL